MAVLTVCDICPSEALADGGNGVRFTATVNGESVPAFAVRYRGQVFAYINRCAHLSVELDWNPGHFFDQDAAYLVCATHGARYYPDSGACAGGRCNGRGLVPLRVTERDRKVQLLISEKSHD